jgi:hypothetical protein
LRRIWHATATGVFAAFASMAVGDGFGAHLLNIVAATAIAQAAMSYAILGLEWKIWIKWAAIFATGAALVSIGAAIQ